jgi:hypothetical protein
MISHIYFERSRSGWLQIYLRKISSDDDNLFRWFCKAVPTTFIVGFEYKATRIIYMRIASTHKKEKAEDCTYCVADGTPSKTVL